MLLRRLARRLERLDRRDQANGSALAIDRKTPFPPFVEIFVGMRLAPPPVDVASDVWIDDLALATSPLPCE